MKTTMKFILGIGVVLALTGIVGNFFSNSPIARGNSEIDYTYTRGSTMYGSNSRFRPSSGEVIELDILESNVQSYLKQFNEDLKISDIFIFEDSEYYFSIIEEDTGLGAMELLVNQYNGDVFPEYGPNMMWNLKYGMHSDSGYGMMGNRGMMSRNYSGSFDTADNLNSTRNTITPSNAQMIAAEYVEDSSTKEYTVSETGHEFYGYYTFHIEKAGETTGMLSVNGFTGEVWYHDWHGTVIEIIDGHEDDDIH